MCRLLAFASGQPTSLAALLSAAELERYRQMSTLHGDGWGAASWNDTAHVEKFNSVQRAVDDDRFGDIANTVARAEIVHLRWATAGLAVCLENTHPFRSGEWSFAHNGSFRDPQLLLPLLEESRRSALEGTTDSEIYFQLLLQKAEELGDVASGVRAAVALIRETCGLGSLNCLLLSEGRLLAVQAFDETPAPVQNLARAAGGEENLPAGHDERYYWLQYTRREGAVVVASTGVGLDQWATLGADAILDVNVLEGSVVVRDLQTGDPRESFSL